MTKLLTNRLSGELFSHKEIGAPAPKLPPKSTDRMLHVLNLGVGVQSVTLWDLFLSGKILNEQGVPIKLDFSIFADTGEEPQHVYRTLKELQKRDKNIIVERKGVLGNDLMRSENSTGQRVASIPCFTYFKEGPLTLNEAREVAIIRRQCTKEYKLDVITRAIRQQIGLKARQRFPKDIRVQQYIGISLDEAGRAVRVRLRFQKLGWADCHFPLIDRDWTRGNCELHLAGRFPFVVGRSACSFCPYHDDVEWQWLKDNDARAWRRNCKMDRALRTPGIIVNRKLDNLLFLHRSCLPIDQVDFKDWRNNYRLNPDDGEAPMFDGFKVECEGMCGV